MIRHRRSLLVALSFGLASAGLSSLAVPVRAADGTSRPAGENAGMGLNNDDWFRRDFDRYSRMYGGGGAPTTQNNTQNNEGGSDFPQANANAWVRASTNATIARALFRRAENDLAMVYRTLQHEFETSADYIQAVKDEKAAYQAVVDARSAALATLANNEKYMALIHMRQDLADQLAARRSRKDISGEEVLAIATIRLNYGTDQRAMELNAMKDDQQIKAAQERLVAAGRKVTDMRAQYAERLRTSPEIREARARLEDARIARIAAEAYANNTAAAGQGALDYAYYLHNRYQANFNTYTDPNYYNGFYR